MSESPDVKKLSLLQKLWLLYFTFAKIAALVVGGGLAMLPVIEETFVDRKKLINKDELLDMVTITQTIPGIIAANSAIYIGMKVAGLIGAVAALLGAITPSFVVIVIIAWRFPELSPDNPYLLGAFAGVRAGVTSLIAVTAWKLAKKSVSALVEAVVVSIFFILALCKVHPALLVISGMLFGLAYCIFFAKKHPVPEKKG